MQPLIPGQYFHIYNRANGSETLFLNSDNYRFFLRKYQKHIHLIAETFCYCLMPNHFHLLVHFKDEEVLKNLPNFKEDGSVSDFLSKQFSNLFSSYSQAFNKQQNRMGSLFMKPFKRKIVSEEGYLKKLIHYIHVNPVEANLVNNPDDWKFSSYASIINENRINIIAYFSDLDNFKYAHTQPTSLSGIDLL